MRRKKNKKIYIRAPVHRPQQESSTDMPTNAAAPTPELRDFGMRVRRRGCSKVTNFDSQIRSSEQIQEKAGVKAKALRRLLQVATGCCALLSLTTSVVSFLVVRKINVKEEISDEALRVFSISLWLLAAFQVLLIALYSVVRQKYLETLRTTLRLSIFPIPSLCKSPQLLCYCVLECVFHILLAPPMVRLQGRVGMRHTYSVMSLEDFLYPLILLRNYHCLRFLFWRSRFSEPRTYLYAVLVDTQFTGGFVLKCILKAFSLRIVFLLYSALVTISGLSLYVFEKGTPEKLQIDASTSIWSAAYTILTIGYGDATPITYFGDILIIISCFLGCFLNSLIFSMSTSHMALNVVESEMYSELAVSRYKGKKMKEALVLLQAWWRFMLMRRRGRLHSYTIIQFYTLLRQYRGVIAAAMREKDRRFDTQISAFGISLNRQFHSLSEYLLPVETARNLATDISRSQYRIKETAKQIRRLACKLEITPPKGVSLISEESEPSQYGRYLDSSRKRYPKKAKGKGLAIAKAKAHQRLRGRLIREQDVEELQTPAEIQSYDDYAVSETPHSQVGRESADI